MRYIIKGNDFSFTWTIKDCNGYRFILLLPTLCCNVSTFYSSIPQHVADAKIVDIVPKAGGKKICDAVLASNFLVKGIEFEVFQLIGTGWRRMVSLEDFILTRRRRKKNGNH